jgi:hypothetical protein
MTLHTREVLSNGAARKLYSKPKLLVYGDLSGLTQANTNMGAMDGAKGKAHGTRLPPCPGMSCG